MTDEIYCLLPSCRGIGRWYGPDVEAYPEAGEHGLGRVGLGGVFKQPLLLPTGLSRPKFRNLRGMSARRPERKPSYSRALVEGAAQWRTNNCPNRGPMARSLTRINRTSRPSPVGCCGCCRRVTPFVLPVLLFFLFSPLSISCYPPHPPPPPICRILITRSFYVTRCL